MPNEKFYHPDADAGGVSHFEVSWWGGDTNTVVPQEHPVLVAGLPVDRSALNRLIRVLRKARDQAFGADE